MNALIPLHTNRCRPEFRNLSAKDQCYLRSVRLGTSERPGGKPQSSDATGGTWTQVGSAERRAQITAALSNGPLRNFEIARAIGTSSPNCHASLERMKADGLVTNHKAPSRRGQGVLWRLAANQPKEMTNG